MEGTELGNLYRWARVEIIARETRADTGAGAALSGVPHPPGYLEGAPGLGI